MRINSIYISGYKIFNPLQNLSLGKSPQLLIGINGSGKSSLLEAIAIIFSTLKEYCLDPKTRERKFEFKIEYSLVLNQITEQTTTTSNQIASIVNVIVSSSKATGLDYSMYVDEQAITDPKEMFKYLPDNLIFYYAGYCDTLEKIVGKAQESQAIGLWRKRSTQKIESIVNSLTKNITYIHKEYFPLLFLLNYVDKKQILPLINKKFTIRNIIVHIQKPKEFSKSNNDYKNLWGLTGFLRTFVDNLLDQVYQIELGIDSKEPYFEISYHRSILEAVENLEELNEDQRYNQTRFFAFHFFTLLYSFGLIKKIDVSITDEDDNIYLIDDLSEGEQQLIIIEAVKNVLCKGNTVLFLDEPDAYLHPQRQRELMPHIESIFSESYTQIIATSHSPFVAQSVPIENIVVFKKGKNITNVTEKNLDYKVIANELFGVKERFAISVEEEINKFKIIRNKIMMGQEINKQELKNIIEKIEAFGEETSIIINRELAQLKQLKQFEL